MKKNILFILIFVAFMVLYMYAIDHNTNGFYNRVSEIIDTSEERMKRDGMNSSQIRHVLSAVEGSAQTSYRFSSMFINVLIPILFTTILSLSWRLSSLEKELREIKKQTDLDKDNA